eukprot:gnl/TRDRNA2_/TRDRNA2_115098_c0_seq1.p1 gnl/TRDRNA2_/TRDRNA2_115098_c0~~gnl/TRDRNA2_/TRDRNA2_115098_c0_seq1.p1  ORF type:complete len:149 (-),score=11.83 gnl/TRDRNA2_/TRDRNA2_115098_c0_seq1:117-563(-)
MQLLASLVGVRMAPWGDAAFVTASIRAVYEACSLQIARHRELGQDAECDMSFEDMHTRCCIQEWTDDPDDTGYMTSPTFITGSGLDEFQWLNLEFVVFVVVAFPYLETLTILWSLRRVFAFVRSVSSSDIRHRFTGYQHSDFLGRNHG